jgi:uridine kinase
MKIVGIAGPSGAGKTTVMNALKSLYPNSVTLSLDTYYKPPAEIKKFGNRLDWEHPDNLVYASYLNALDQLIEQGPRLILTEGYLLFHDPEILHRLDLKIFLNITERLQIERRKTRKMRDNTPHEVDDEYNEKIFLPGVRNYVIPTMTYANCIIDASAPIAEVIQQCQIEIDRLLS